MTLLNIMTKVKERFSNADVKDVCCMVNELENRLMYEIFSPHGVECRHRELDVKKDMNTPLILDEKNISLYIYFIFAVLSLRELDFEASEAYSTLFNERFSELSVFYRRNNIPLKNAPLKGGF